MRSAPETHHHLERELARAGRKARPDAGDLRDRARGRRRKTHLDPGARPADRRRHPLGRPPGLARDPVEPQEPAGDRTAAGHQDGPAAADAGRAAAVGDRDAVIDVWPSYAGLTRVSITFEKSSRDPRWIAGSSPAMTPVIPRRAAA